MKKKSLIKNLSLIGLTLATASCEKQENNILEKQDNHPSSLKGNQSSSIGFTPILELNLPDSVNNQVIALTTLVEDIFKDPSIAQSFSLDPQSYLNSKGIKFCNIDINSVEVKTIIALGDKEVRDAIITNDLPAFLRLLEAKKYITFDNTYFNGTLKNYLESEVLNNADIKKLLKNMPEINEKAIFLVAAVVAYVAVATMFWVYISIETRISSPEPNIHTDITALFSHGYDFNNPVLKIWGLENNSHDVLVVNELIEQNLDKLVDMIEMMDVYQQSSPKMKHEDLKNWLRKPITQYFIDAGLI